MKKTVTKIVDCCDKCEKECAYPAICLYCGIEVCWDCERSFFKKYELYGSHKSGLYCNECDIRLTASESDPLHKAYLKIISLNEEERLYYKDSRNREDELCKLIETLHEKKEEEYDI